MTSKKKNSSSHVVMPKSRKLLQSMPTRLTGLAYVFSLFSRASIISTLSLFQERKPSWWIVLADEKSNRIVVPPLKITDIPNTRLPNADADEALLEHDYRAYKIQFQSPPNVGMFTWKVYVVSDTFVGGEVTRDITVSISLSRVSVYY